MAHPGRVVGRLAWMLSITPLAASPLAAPAHAQPCRSWTAPVAVRHVRNPIPSTEASLGEGRRLFGDLCVMCHGPAGRGDGGIAASLPRPPANLSDSRCLARRSDGELFWWISNGNDVMPAFESLGVSDEDRWRLVNVVRQLGR
jgi:mono/diheme cytochrome c family protein